MCLICTVAEPGFKQWQPVGGAVEHMTLGASRGGCRKGVRHFLRHEICKNSVSSVEAGMGMEGQIMCIEQCTF